MYTSSDMRFLVCKIHGALHIIAWTVLELFFIITCTSMQVMDCIIDFVARVLYATALRN